MVQRIMWFNGISLNICLFRWYLVIACWQTEQDESRRVKTSTYDTKMTANHCSGSLLQHSENAASSSLPETMDKSFHINLHIYRLPEKKH